MRLLTMTILLAGLSACGGGDGAATDGAATQIDPAAASTDASTDVSSGAGGGETIAATRAQVEEAWKCRGLMTAAAAAKDVLPASEVPEDVAGITPAMPAYWTDRAGRLKAPDMSEADVDTLIVSSTRMLATREALERELPNIRACIAAQEGA